MEVFYKGRKHRTNATVEYDLVSGKLIVKKGSIVSESVADFRGASTVKRLRESTVDSDGIDIEFNQ